MQQGRMWHKKGILWDLLLEWEEKQNLRGKNFNISRQSILQKSWATFFWNIIPDEEMKTETH